MDVDVLEYPKGGPPRRARAVVRVPIDGATVVVELHLVQFAGEGGTAKPWETSELRLDLRHAHGLSTSVIRQIPFSEVERTAVEAIAGDRPRVADRLAEEIEHAGLVGPRPSTLRLVGAVYEDELERGGNPVQEIAKAFGISRSSATRWVRRARDDGYIGRLEREPSKKDFNYLTKEQRAAMLEKPAAGAGDGAAKE